jgi:FkbM family methyltransferase
MNGTLLKILRLRKVILKKDIYLNRQHRCPKLSLGHGYNAWTVQPHLLNSESIVYSIGVGLDISFDLELINKFHTPVYAYDPTPKSVNWIKNQELPPKFHFYELGVADYDGTATFTLPENPGFVSGRIKNETKDTKKIKVEVRRLQTLMNSNHHSYIDLLKMDIEGAEYAVINDIINSDLKIKQLLVEFHHRFDDIGIALTKDTVRKLNDAGYMIFYVSASGEEVSFINERI